MASPSGARRPGRGLGAVAAYAVAMGWLEAVVVVYLRSLVGLEHGQRMPEPMDVMARLGEHPWLIRTEQTREVATLAMLAAVGWLASPAWRGRIGAFLVAFGIWDIVYYVGLRVLVGWPRSLGALDLLFLIPPHPWWYQPIWLPTSIALVMVVAGVALFRSVSRALGEPGGG